MSGACRLHETGAEGPRRLADQTVVAPYEKIAGRVVSAGRVLLLTDRNQLAVLDLAAGSVRGVPLSGLGPTDALWGLALSRDGSLWTLIGRTALGQIGEEGRLVRRVELAQPHIGLFAWGDRLVYQPVNVNPGEPALFAGPPGNEGRQALAGLTLRPSTISRIDMLVRNLIVCGVGTGGELPCWFFDSTTVERLRDDGTATEVRLEEIGDLPDRAAEEQRPGPIRDVWLMPSGEMWVLIVGSSDTGGGRLLVRYSSAGSPVATVAPAQPARLILAVAGRVCHLLTQAGRVEEVALP